jgi:hypothetical protein
MQRQQRKKQSRQAAARSSNRNALARLVDSKANLRYQGGLEVVKNANPVFTLKLPIAAQMVSSTATPTIAQVSNITAAMIDNFTTRWGTVFREYCILGADIRLAAVGGNAGIAVAWLDELNSSSPTLATAGTADHVSMSLTVGDPTSTCMISWKLSEINDSGFTAASSTSPVPGAVKIWSDTPNYGLTAATAKVILLDGHLTIAFRGIL